MVPLVASKLITICPRVVVALAETVMTALAVPSAGTETLVGLSMIVGGCIVLLVGVEKLRMTLPVNEFRLVRSSLKLVDSPRCITDDDSEDASKE